MSEQTTDTFLNPITDNFGDNFFDGGASSKNVLTQEDVDNKTAKKDEPEVKKEAKVAGLGNFIDDKPYSAEQLLGDRLEIDDKPIDHVKKQEPEQVKEVKLEIDFNSLIEEGILAPFEDDAPIKSKEDLHKLVEANKEHWVSKSKLDAIKELQDSLPEEVKFLVDYAKKGGQDLKSVMKLLSQTQEFREYDVEKKEDQKALVRAYYETQGWSDDEIEEEVVNLSEGDRLKTQAQKLKPKLDRINQDEIASKKQEQDFLEQQEIKAREFFTDNVMNTLKQEKIGDIKLTREEKNDIYHALVKESYTSISGKTNRLGAILDKIQYSNKPDYEHLMEITMLASDRDGFKKKIRDQITADVTADQVKKIKIEQQKQKIGSEQTPEKETKRLPKLGTGFINPF